MERVTYLLLLREVGEDDFRDVLIDGASSCFCSAMTKASSLLSRASHSARYCAIQPAASISGSTLSAHGLRCAWRLREIKPARSSVRKCLVTAGTLMANGAASSVSVRSPCASS